MTVDSFFQETTEDALIEQVKWVQTELEISDDFFCHLLRVDERDFRRWKNKNTTISEERQQELRELWQVVLHLLSLFCFNTERVRLLLQHDSAVEQTIHRPSPFDPPWIGRSMKTYLETAGLPGIRQVNRWVQGIRFAESY